MPYLIDGHNLIPKIPGLSLKSIDDEIQLIQYLQDFCRQSGKNVEVYFDNAPAGQARTQNFGPVKAHFVHAGRTADDAIVDRLLKLGRASQNWTVVSSDRQVQASARAAHASVISSDEFVKLILSSQPGEDSDHGADAEISLSSVEIDEWMDLFGGEPDASDTSADLP